MEEPSVHEAIGYSFGYQLEQLREFFHKEEDWPNPKTAFAYWVLFQSDFSLELEGLFVPEDRVRDTPILASVGYLLDIPSYTVETDTASLWKDHLERRFEQKIVSRERDSFFFRPYDLLGITLGLCRFEAEMESEVAILQNAMRDGQEYFSARSPSDQIISSVAASLLGASWPISSFDIDGFRVPELCHMYWALRTYPDAPLQTDGTGTNLTGIIDQILAQALKGKIIDERSPIQEIAITYHALDSILQENIEQLQLGYRNQARKEAALKREERLKRLERVESWIQSKAEFTFKIAQLVFSALIAMIAIPVELYVIGAFGELQDPLSVESLPTKLWSYATSSLMPLIIVVVISVSVLIGVYNSTPVRDLADRFKHWRKNRLRDRVLGVNENSD